MSLRHEPDDPHDSHAIAVKRPAENEKGTSPSQIVDHVPLTLSRLLHFFLNWHGEKISVEEETGKRRNKGIGLEIPAMYIFTHKKPSNVKKLIDLSY